MTIPFKASDQVPTRRDWLSYYRRRIGAYAVGWPQRSTRGRILVACEPRTGSELLCRTIAGAYRASYDGEVFKTPSLHPVPYCRGRARRAALRGEGYVAKLITRQVREGMHFSSGPDLLQGLHDAGFVLVRLQRRDEVAAAVSLLRAMTLGIWHQRSGSAPTDQVTVHPGHLLTALTLNEINAAWWQWASDGLPVEHVVYEEHLAAPGALELTVRRLGELAGLEPTAAPTGAALVRTSVGSWRDSVTNVDEVEAALAGTRFASLVGA